MMRHSKPLLKLILVLLVTTAVGLAPVHAQPQSVMGTEEFGMTPKQLVAAVTKVETLIAKCMRDQGFDYVAVDYQTVRRGMNADKTLPGMSTKEFFAKHGFGLSTLYTGDPPQLAKGYSPGREGLGERNVQAFARLPAADQVAYNRALLGENTSATFANSLEQENFSQTGGCTRKAVSQAFKATELAASYYNPKDDQINKDPRMKEAVRKYAAEMRKAGFNYSHPDDVEPDIRRRLNALTQGGTLPVSKMSPTQLSALKELQAYELGVGIKHRQVRDTLVDPVADKVEEALFARKTQ